MYKEHPNFIKPQGSKVKLWRYMDFTKFVNMLNKNELFFARADKLGDPFEGSYPKENVQQRAISHQKMLEQLPSHAHSIFKGRDKAVSTFFRNMRKLIFINSWHESQYESAAMWRLYLKSNEGIAIQSTFGRLKGCFKQGTPDIYIGKVYYRDYLTEKISENNLFAPFTHKMKSFEHEKEVRALFMEFEVNKNGLPNLLKPTSLNGIGVTVDLEELIANIYVAPENPKWFFELVKSVTRKYGLKKIPVQSSLDARPLY
jgi:hypothetical protein